MCLVRSFLMNGIILEFFRDLFIFFKKGFYVIVVSFFLNEGEGFEEVYLLF